MHLQLTPDEWTAVGAVGTCAAVGVAFLALGVERYAHWREARDRDAAQARLVTIAPPEMASGDVVQVHVINLSQGPVIGLELDAARWVDAAQTLNSWRVPPTIFGAQPATSVIKPGDTFKIPIEWIDDEEKRITLQVPGELQAAVSFYDAAGLEWERIGNGQPKRRRNRRMWAWKSDTTPRV
ncbi:hypothetical protein [Nocardioides taihuensis]|uniref:Uncharacterized protein n=1 Tax=Nocardioides taihuensis TaxID=1835606 RepID=A0ABW0BJB7_9ACTN